MGEVPSSHCQLIPQSSMVFCENFNCRNRAAYSIGKKDGPMSLHLNLCSDCVNQLIESIPKELLSGVSGPSEEELKARVDLEVSLKLQEVKDQVLEEVKQSLLAEAKSAGLLNEEEKSFDSDVPEEVEEIKEEEPEVIKGTKRLRRR